MSDLLAEPPGQVIVTQFPEPTSRGVSLHGPRSVGMFVSASPLRHIERSSSMCAVCPPTRQRNPWMLRELRLLVGLCSPKPGCPLSLKPNGRRKGRFRPGSDPAGQPAEWKPLCPLFLVRSSSSPRADYEGKSGRPSVQLSTRSVAPLPPPP